MTSGSKAKGRFVKQDFVYLAEEDVYRCPAGERLTYHYTNVEKGLTLYRYWTTACHTCAIKDQCTSGKERRIPAGNTNMFLRLSRGGSTNTRRRCANGAKRSSIRSKPSNPGWDIHASR